MKVCLGWDEGVPWPKKEEMLNRRPPAIGWAPRMARKLPREEKEKGVPPSLPLSIPLKAYTSCVPMSLEFPLCGGLA